MSAATAGPARSSAPTPDILRDLARQFGGHGADLHPRGAEEAIEAVCRLCEQGITWAAQRTGVSGGDSAAGETALATLDTVHRHHLDAAAVHRIPDHPRLWAYARRSTAHPAFGTHLDLDGVARRHHAHCRGEEAAGVAARLTGKRGGRPASGGFMRLQSFLHHPPRTTA